MEPTTVRLTIPESVDPGRLLGPSDQHLRRIEASFDALVTVRGSQVKVVGAPEVCARLTSVFTALIRLVESGETPTEADVEQAIASATRDDRREPDVSFEIVLTHKGRPIRPKTVGQARYVEAMRTHPITFGIGPAGTGKTYLAMAMALSALKRREVARIVLTRPVVEAGESLGFLPGTLEDKLAPYVRPLYDALFDMCDRDRALAYIEQGVVEIAPLAYMRGRTLSDSFVILDEAQNTTPDQMQMFLTRLGFSSRFVATGDLTQTDVRGRSGIEDAHDHLADIDSISFQFLTATDVCRHTLVTRIVEAYERGPIDRKAGRDGR